MTGYKIYWNAHGPGLAPNWVPVDTIYTKLKSATQRRRRILQNGIANPFSGCGKIYPTDAYVKTVKVQ